MVPRDNEVSDMGEQTEGLVLLYYWLKKKQTRCWVRAHSPWVFSFFEGADPVMECSWILPCCLRNR